MYIQSVSEIKGAPCTHTEQDKSLISDTDNVQLKSGLVFLKFFFNLMASSPRSKSGRFFLLFHSSGVASQNFGILIRNLTSVIFAYSGI